MDGYKECFVAFIDILGFKNIIGKYNYDDLVKIFDELSSFEPHPLVRKPELYEHIGYSIMSDSIIVYIETVYEDSFIALADVCNQIQIRLSSLNPPVMVRGGIACGNLHHKDNVLFGDALTKAYILESTLAKYPRIVFTEETHIKALKNMGRLYVFDYNKMYYNIDEDMLYYIDYMHTFCFIPSLGELDQETIIKFDNDYFDRLYKYVEDQLAILTDSSVREKYLWLRKKITNEIECKPEVKKWIDEKKRKRQKEKDIRFKRAIEK